MVFTTCRQDEVETDGSSSNNPGDAGRGGILRDSRGEIVFCFYYYLWRNNNIFALELGWKSAILLSLTEIQVEFDSEIVINWCKVKE